MRLPQPSLACVVAVAEVRSRSIARMLGLTESPTLVARADEVASTT
jgi:hypothetical protein